MDISGLYSIFRKHANVCIDSRRIIPGALFFALKGTQFDGNKFAEQALDNGCSFAIVDDPTCLSDPRIILVEDVLFSLQELARFHREQMSIPIIAITGSNGKTTTKELTASMLCTSFKAIATVGNLNNHIGVPLSVLKINDKTEIAIIEMGANHVGEIAQLCTIAQPDHGIITNIGSAHLEGFGSIENIKKAKGELYDWLGRNSGIIFQNAEDDTLQELPVGMAKVVSFKSGTEQFSDLSLTPWLECIWHSGDQPRPLKTKLFGKYNIENIAAGIAISQYFGVQDDDLVAALESYIPANNRSQVIETGKNILILDAYNANPSSMRTAVENFMNMKGGPKVLILGDMLELGEKSFEEHQKFVDYLYGLDVDQIVLIGSEFFKASAGAGMTSFESVQDYQNYLVNHPVMDSQVFLKGSRLLKLEELAPLF